METQQQQQVLDGLKQQFGDQYQDNTQYLRNMKNSAKIRQDILKMEKCKRTFTGNRNSEEFRELCVTECRFIYDEYTYLFNKLLKDVVDLKIMFTLLKVMQDIETGKVNQEEGSVLVGKILKELYLDCATREGELSDQQYEADKIVPLEGKALSWKQFRARMMNPLI